jgi:hypothetical protein
MVDLMVLKDVGREAGMVPDPPHLDCSYKKECTDGRRRMAHSGHPLKNEQ